MVSHDNSKVLADGDRHDTKIARCLFGRVETSSGSTEPPY